MYTSFLILCLACTQSIAQSSKSPIAQSYMDVLTADVSIAIDAEAKQVSGTVVYTLKLLEATKTIYIDAQSMLIEQVALDGKEIPFTYDTKKISIANDYKNAAKHSISITYKATPKKAMYFVKDYDGKDQIWTQGQGKYTSNWLPSFDDMNEKIIFDFKIDVDSSYEVIANGKLIKKEKIDSKKDRWYYDMKSPMSSYLVAIVVGDYAFTRESSATGIPLLNYYYPKDSLKVAATYRHNKRIFDFLSTQINVPFPWQNYKQIPVKDFLYAGMENTGTTVFSDAFVVDDVGYVDRNYISVNAHELAHQWFGNLITATEGKHHWLQEGFATYYALLAEKEVFGEDYFVYKLYESAEQLTALSKTDKATSVLDAKASSLTFYQRGAWALYALKATIGAAAFDTTIKTYLERYAFKNVTTSDFMEIASEVSGQELSEYENTWLVQPKFPSKEALALLTASPFMKQYLSLAKERTQPLQGKLVILGEGLDFPVNEYMGQEVIYQLAEETSPEAIALYAKAFETENVVVRQAIANTLQTIPKALKQSYESLLKDASYTTVEAALYRLWTNFPEDRSRYLDETKTIIGFRDHNVRTLWLALAISTPSYPQSEREQLYTALNAYTSTAYNTNTRRNAFGYLESLSLFSDPSLVALIDGAMHHNWRFRNYCRKLLDRLLVQEKYKNKYVFLKSNLSIRQHDFLQKRITP